MMSIRLVCTKIAIVLAAISISGSFETAFAAPASGTSFEASSDNEIQTTLEPTASPTYAPPTFCGNSVLEESEQCDDGNSNSDDGCSSSCYSEYCGDYVTSPGIGEQCDDGWANGTYWSNCSSDCRVSQLCGNGLVEAGEQCDEGWNNGNYGSSCDSSCQLAAVCGNGVLEASEQCDDGNSNSDDGCSSNCYSEYCGDYVTSPGIGEQCDDGWANGSYWSSCSSDCRLNPVCGNGVQEGYEQCDDWNTSSGDGCSASCTLEYCGDYVTTPSIGEQCDEGWDNGNYWSSCSSDCQLNPVCGSGLTLDSCGLCGGDGYSCAGCDGVPNSGLTVDACGVCGGDNSSCLGCDGIANSGKILDLCGVCGGDNSSCLGCDGIANSGKKRDVCFVCDGDGTSCLGCDGVPYLGHPNNKPSLDACGVCAGDNSSCAGCDGIANSGKTLDVCGVCDGDGSSCAVCAGVGERPPTPVAPAAPNCRTFGHTVDLPGAETGSATNLLNVLNLEASFMEARSTSVVSAMRRIGELEAACIAADGDYLVTSEIQTSPEASCPACTKTQTPIGRESWSCSVDAQFSYRCCRELVPANLGSCELKTLSSGEPYCFALIPTDDGGQQSVPDCLAHTSDRNGNLTRERGQCLLFDGPSGLGCVCHPR